jgi:hypothetical protein
MEGGGVLAETSRDGKPRNPLTGPLGDRSSPSAVLGLPKSLIGPKPGSPKKTNLTQAPPRWGDFSESANVHGAEPPQGQTFANKDRHRHGPLGDRSLSRRSLGYMPGSFHKLSLTREPPRWGDFSESANVRRHAPPAEIGPLSARPLARLSWSIVNDSDPTFAKDRGD